ncbi:MAG: hypothetical protein IPJ17_00090 [Holophagales bacterium]|nr:MAG: hypothetical protein IPJ17_00090 [Holophagales bacterium]
MPFSRVVGKGDVQFRLQSGVAGPMPLDEAEERFVARVLAERVSDGVILREVQPEAEKALEELRVVGREESVDADGARVGAPGQEQFEQILSAHRQRRIERILRFEGEIVAVGQEQQSQGLVLALQRDSERRTLPPTLRRSSRELQRSPGLNPALHVVEPAGSAELEELREVSRRGGESRWTSWVTGRRVRPRVDERHSTRLIGGRGHLQGRVIEQGRTALVSGLALARKLTQG